MDIKTFAFVVNGEVVGTFHVPPSAPNYDRLIAGLSSSPQVLDASSTPNVRFGWTFDGENFIAPGE